MAIQVDPLSYVITVPKADLILVSGTLYRLDTNAFRLELKAWEDDPDGIVHPKTHEHNTEVVIAGQTYARAIEVLSPYSVTFEDGQYSVILVNSNNNIWDIESGVLNQNQVQVIPTNAAGLIVTTVGSGVTEQDKQDIAALSSTSVWSKPVSSLTDISTIGGYVAKQLLTLRNFLGNR